MSVFDTFVAKRQTLVDFCNHRRRLPGCYKSNDDFKIGPKVIMS